MHRFRRYKERQVLLLFLIFIRIYIFISGSTVGGTSTSYVSTRSINVTDQNELVCEMEV